MKQIIDAKIDPLDKKIARVRFIFAMLPEGTLLLYTSLIRIKTAKQEITHACPSTRVTQLRGQNVSGFFWVNNERILFTTGGDQLNGIRGAIDSIGLYAVNKDGSKPTQLVKPEDALTSKLIQTIPLNRLNDDPDHILVMRNDRKRYIMDVYRMNVYNGKFSGKSPLQAQSSTGQLIVTVYLGLQLFKMKNLFHMKQRSSTEMEKMRSLEKSIVLKDYKMVGEPLVGMKTKKSLHYIQPWKRHLCNKSFRS